MLYIERTHYIGYGIKTVDSHTLALTPAAFAKDENWDFQSSFKTYIYIYIEKLKSNTISPCMLCDAILYNSNLCCDQRAYSVYLFGLSPQLISNEFIKITVIKIL